MVDNDLQQVALRAQSCWFLDSKFILMKRKENVVPWITHG